MTLQTDWQHNFNHLSTNAAVSNDMSKTPHYTRRTAM